MPLVASSDCRPTDISKEAAGVSSAAGGQGGEKAGASTGSGAETGEGGEEATANELAEKVTELKLEVNLVERDLKGLRAARPDLIFSPPQCPEYHEWLPTLSACFPTSPEFSGLRVKAQDLAVPKFAANVTAPMLDSRSHPAYFKNVAAPDAYSEDWLNAKLSVAGSQCSVAHTAQVPGVYKWSFFGLTKLGDECPDSPTGYNRFGKPIYECEAVIRLDPRALASTPGPHTVIVYPGPTSAENSVAYGIGLAARGGAGACTAGDSSAFFIRAFDKFDNPRLSGGDGWQVQYPGSRSHEWLPTLSACFPTSLAFSVHPAPKLGAGRPVCRARWGIIRHHLAFLDG